MSRIIRDFDSIRDVLLASIGNRVTIILSSGRILRVVVEAVVDNLLIASANDRIITVNINRIDAVITCCRQLFAAIIDRRSSRTSDASSDNSRSRESLGIVDDSRSRTSRIVADDGSRSRSLGISADLATSRSQESRRHDNWVGRRSYDSSRLSATDSPITFGYIRHEGNLDRYFC